MKRSLLQLAATGCLVSSAYGVRVPMGNGLSLGTQVNVDYDAVPAAGKETTDTALIFNLDYAL